MCKDSDRDQCTVSVRSGRCANFAQISVQFRPDLKVSRERGLKIAPLNAANVERDGGNRKMLCGLEPALWAAVTVGHHSSQARGSSRSPALSARTHFSRDEGGINFPTDHRREKVMTSKRMDFFSRAIERQFRLHVTAAARGCSPAAFARYLVPARHDGYIAPVRGTMGRSASETISSFRVTAQPLAAHLSRERRSALLRPEELMQD